MAMNKKEKAFVEEMRARAALTLPPYEKPVPMTRDEIKTAMEANGVKAITAWFLNAAYLDQVTEGWTNGTCHNAWVTIRSSKYNRQILTPGPGDGYRTKLEAVRAIRWRETKEAMRKLAAIDQIIEAYEEEENGNV